MKKIHEIFDGGIVGCDAVSTCKWVQHFGGTCCHILQVCYDIYYKIITDG
jgi:hypothetical protein